MLCKCKDFGQVRLKASNKIMWVEPGMEVDIVVGETGVPVHMEALESAADEKKRDVELAKNEAEVAKREAAEAKKKADEKVKAKEALAKAAEKANKADKESEL